MRRRGVEQFPGLSLPAAHSHKVRTLDFSRRRNLNISNVRQDSRRRPKASVRTDFFFFGILFGFLLRKEAPGRGKRVQTAAAPSGPRSVKVLVHTTETTKLFGCVSGKEEEWGGWFEWGSSASSSNDARASGEHEEG